MKIVIIPHWVRATLARYDRNRGAMMDKSFMSDVFSRSDVDKLREIQLNSHVTLGNRLNAKLSSSMFLEPDYLPGTDHRDFYEEVIEGENESVDPLVGRVVPKHHHVQFYANTFVGEGGEPHIAVDVCVEEIDTPTRLEGNKQFIESLICKLYENQYTTADLVRTGLIGNYTKRLL